MLTAQVEKGQLETPYQERIGFYHAWWIHKIGIFTAIYLQGNHKHQANVCKCTSPMDPMGYEKDYYLVKIAMTKDFFRLASIPRNHPFTGLSIANSLSFGLWRQKKRRLWIGLSWVPQRTWLTFPFPNMCHVPLSKLLPYIGDGDPTFNRESLQWVYNPYSKVDDHPYHRKTMGF